MLTKVEVRNAIGTLVLTLPVGEATPTSPYLVKEISGLGPVKANIVTSDYANQDGGFFQSARTGGRSLGLKLKYRPNYGTNGTIEALRWDLYYKFPPKSPVSLRFYSTNRPTVEIKGVTEDHIPDIFAKEPEVTVAIFCAKPNFNELTTISNSGTAQQDIIMPYAGNADVGFILNMTTLNPFKKMTFKNYIDPDVTFDFNGAMEGGVPFNPDFVDQIEFSTLPGNKYARLTRTTTGGTVYNILKYMTVGSLDMKLGPDTTKIRMNLYNASNGPVETVGNGIVWICTNAYVGL